MARVATSPFLLVNANVSRPLVSPVGLEYAGTAVAAAGIPVEVLDLAFETDWRSALRRTLSRREYLAVGTGVRNTDDCSMASRVSFLPWICELVREVKSLSGATVILGGGGFSIFPAPIVQLTGADYGVAGDGEETLPLLLKRLSQKGTVEDIPNVVFRQGQRVRQGWRALANPPGAIPLPRRQLFDNPRYQREGAMVGIETKRGCNGGCIYCADPVARGRAIRLRPPLDVVEEMKGLLGQGVSWFHLSDSEFNLPPGHAREVCHALISNGLGDKVRWYCYCSPVPFDAELASLMKKAGCAGVNFGVDSLDDGQLALCRRLHRLEHMKALVNILKESQMNFIFDLLVGAPGEEEATLRNTFEQVRKLDVPLVGMAVGVRVYSGTAVGKRFRAGLLADGLYPPGARDALEPVFYLSPRLGEDPWELVRHLAGNDPRFLLLSRPSQEGSYNYAGDDTLSKAIEEGARGAYWDILRKRRT